MERIYLCVVTLALVFFVTQFGCGKVSDSDEKDAKQPNTVGEQVLAEFIWNPELSTEGNLAGYASNAIPLLAPIRKGKSVSKIGYVAYETIENFQKAGRIMDAMDTNGGSSALETSNHSVVAVERLSAAEEHRYKQLAAILTDGADLGDWMASKGLEIGKGQQNGKALVHFAAEEGRIDVLKLLFAYSEDRRIDYKDRIDFRKPVNTGDNSGWCHMHLAAFSGQVETMKWLKDNVGESGAIINMSTVHQKEGGYWLPIHCAAFGGQVESMKWLKEQGANIHATAKPPHQGGHAPMHLAARRGHIEAMKWLKDQGVDVNVRTANDRVLWTPMHEAAGGGRVEVMKWLRGQGAVVSDTCMTAAAWDGHLEAMKWLKAQGIKVDVTNEGGVTPMHQAARNGQVEVMKWLKEQGADLNPIGTIYNGLTPMHLAAMSGHVDVMKWLKDQGVDVNVKSIWGQFDNADRTPMHLAARGTAMGGSTENNVKRIEALKWLAQQGADVNAKDGHGYAPIHCVYDEDLEMYKCFKALGADINMKDKYGKTPLDRIGAGRGGGITDKGRAVQQWLRANGAVSGQ